MLHYLYILMPTEVELHANVNATFGSESDFAPIQRLTCTIPVDNYLLGGKNDDGPNSSRL